MDNAALVAAVSAFISGNFQFDDGNDGDRGGGGVGGDDDVMFCKVCKSGKSFQEQVEHLAGPHGL